MGGGYGTQNKQYYIFRSVTKSNDEIPRSEPREWSWHHSLKSATTISKLVEEGKLKVEDSQGPDVPELLKCTDCHGEEGLFQAPESLIEHRLTHHPGNLPLRCLIDGGLHLFLGR